MKARKKISSGSFLDGVTNESTSLEKVTRFTAAELFKTSPTLYRSVAEMRIGEGLPINEVARLCGVTPGVVAAVQRREVGSLEIEKYKAIAAAEWRHVGMMARARIVEKLTDGDIDSMRLGDLGILAGVAETKLSELDGPAVIRVEVSQGAPSVADYEARIKSARRVTVDISETKTPSP